MKDGKKTLTVDKYIAQFPLDIQEKLELIRSIILRSVKDVTEDISWGMPAYKFHGVVAYFAVHTNHIGFYPTAEAIDAFKSEITKYVTSKGTVQLPLDKPIPKTLIKKIVAFKSRQNLEKFLSKKKK